MIKILDFTSIELATVGTTAYRLSVSVLHRFNIGKSDVTDFRPNSLLLEVRELQVYDVLIRHTASPPHAEYLMIRMKQKRAYKRDYPARYSHGFQEKMTPNEFIVFNIDSVRFSWEMGNSILLQCSSIRELVQFGHQISRKWNGSKPLPKMATKPSLEDLKIQLKRHNRKINRD